MSAFARLRHQVNFDLLIFRRNPAATFFTVVLPIIFLVIFTSLFGNETLDNGAKVATLYVPGILALSIISATAVNLAISMTSRRERGRLKRVRGTPVPPSTFILSQSIGGVVISAVMTVLIIALGFFAYGVDLNLASVPTLVITILIGAAAFSALGLAMTVIIPSEDAAPAVTNAIMLPLYFISDVFIPGDQVPDWVATIAGIFPVQHLSRAMQDSFDPFVDGATWPWTHWAVLLAWGAFGTLVALKWFRWTPWR